MARQALVLGMLLLMSGCTSEHRTVVMSAADPCTNYGFTASSADYVRCQQMIADQRHAGRMAAGYSDARSPPIPGRPAIPTALPRGSAQFDRCVQDEFAARRPG